MTEITKSLLFSILIRGQVHGTQPFPQVHIALPGRSGGCSKRQVQCIAVASKFCSIWPPSLKYDHIYPHMIAIQCNSDNQKHIHILYRQSYDNLYTVEIDKTIVVGLHCHVTNSAFPIIRQPPKSDRRWPR